MKTYFSSYRPASIRRHRPTNTLMPFCQGGFSLFELLITLGLMAIISSLAIPSYQDAIEKRRVTNGAETILSFVTIAQGESLKRNRAITVSYSASEDGTWCIGAAVGDTDCDCTITDPTETAFCAIEGTEWVLRNTDVASDNLVSVLSGDGAYAFDPVRGIFKDPADSMVLAINSGSGEFQMNLSVINTGKISVCLPSISQPIPGFDQCVQEM